MRAGQATYRFPAAAAAICVVAAIANWAVAFDLESTDPWARALLALTAGAAASVAATLFAESRGAGLGAARLAGCFGLALLGAAVGFAHPFLLTGPALTIAIVAAVPLAPFVGRGSSRAFWDFTLWTALGATLGWLSVLIFLLGFTAIFEMIRTLFGVGLGGDAYAHLFTTGLTLVGPLFALGRIPHPDETPAEDRASERLERAVRPLFEWVTAPLVLAAGVIIHVYAARIVLTGDVPTNEIGWIVLLYSGFMLSLRVGLEPYLADLPHPARFFARFWATMLVVPLALLGYALALRVGSEGWTIERYFSAVYGLAAAIAVFLQVLPRTRGDIRAIVAIAPILLVLSTFGPWGVADTVGRSQTALIVLRHGSVLERGPEATRGLDGAARAELQSRIGAIEDVAEEERLAQVLGAFAGVGPAERLADLRRALDAAAVAEAKTVQERDQSFSIEEAWDTGGFDRMLAPISASAHAGDAVPPTSLDGGELVVTYRGRTDRFALAAALEAAPRDEGATLPMLVLDLRSAEGRDIRLRVTHARWNAAGQPVLVQGWLALRHGEWAGP
ncbi:DUF4153 domain-containing protein [Aureimonas sp. SK2]|uniref:DUF4153 domain-containing protein n=1 Tax=Aureimonas sp. SK2 TaxID=3015992 RepID=UPI0024449D9D|nr:DUF4153 domain-containing protein [Aureimonas sp. SK2]